MARLYLPMTTALLRRLHETGEVPVEVERRPLDLGDEGDEEAEYAALQDAADAAAGLLDAPGRRVVVVAQAPPDERPLSLRRVVAVHADDADVDPADYDDPPELGWWATQEIADLLGDR